MASRPAWTISNNTVISKDFDFVWNGGFAISQKQKNITALHQAITDSCDNTTLEVSTKGLVDIGVQLSAFNLKLDGVFLENIFQSSKKYEKGGPYLDLLKVSPKESKQDDRHKNSGKLVAFVYDGFDWSLEPKTAFYDYIYIKAVLQNFGENLDLSEYDWFTDIEFNPKKSINCQARALTIFKLLQSKNFDVLNSVEDWITFHKKYVLG